MTQLNLSARAYHRARSVKLAGSKEIQPVHLPEALHAHPHCNTPALAGGARERSAAQVLQ